jgi:xylulokinase
LANFHLLAGLDLGTSACKCAVINTDGVLLASASRPYPVHSPHPGWAEQDPQDWFHSAVDSLRAALEEAEAKSHSKPRIAAIGLSGQMHTTVCLGPDGLPLRPAILWSDTRSAAMVKQINRQVGIDQLRAWTGNRLAAGFTLATWQWLRRHESEVFRRTRWILLPKDALRLQLTGEIGTEPSDASATLLFDPFQRAWSRALLDALHLDPAVLPQLHSSQAVAGGLLAVPAQLAGLPGGIPVVFGGSDQSMQALGSAIIRPGQVSAAIGTGGQIFAPLAAPIPDPSGRLHLFCHALPDLWHLEAAILSAGASLHWLRDQIASGSSFTELADAAAAVPPGSEGLYFLPYLSGERTPYFDPQRRAGFIGLSMRHTRAHLVRAVMEGVVFAMRQGLDLIRALGVQPAEIAISGGSARHPLWRQLQADIYGVPVRSTPGSANVAAVGAALLAGVGVGAFSSADEACTAVRQSAGEGSLTLPDPDRAARYTILYEGYRELAGSRLARAADGL